MRLTESSDKYKIFRNINEGRNTNLIPFRATGGACREGRRFNAGLTSAVRREKAPEQLNEGSKIVMVEKL